MIFVTVAVAIFILYGLRYSSFWKKNPSLSQFYSQAEIDDFRRKFAAMITIGVTIILINVIILFSIEAFFPIVDEIEYLESFATAFFMLFVTFAVSILVYAGIKSSKYNITHWNEMHDENSEAYKKDKLKSTVCGCLMMIATILYLIVIFVIGKENAKSMSAIVAVFPVFGIMCGIASVIVDHRPLNGNNKKNE